jgi:hypothetical protein
MSAVRISAIAPDPDPHGAAQSAAAWPQANQTYLVLEFARLRRRLDPNTAAHDDDTLDMRARQVRQTLQPPAAIDQLSVCFGLSEFERQIVLLAAGIEMDSTLAALCTDAMGRERRAGGAIRFALALGILDDPHWSALAPAGPLRRHRLIELETGQGLTAAALRIDERILHYLAGVNRLDARLEALLRTRTYPPRIADEHIALVDEALQAVELAGAHAPAVHLCGDDPRGQEDIACVIARRVGRQLHILPIENLTHGGDAAGFDAPPSMAQFRTLWTREASLLPAVLLVQCDANIPGATTRQLIESLPAPLIIASREPLRLDRPIQRYTVNKPTPGSQKHLWAKAIGVGPIESTGSATLLEPVVDTLSEQFRLSAEAIATLGSSIGASLHAADASVSQTADRLWNACRSLSRPRLEALAERIVPEATWDDLILPDTQKETLRQLSSQARHRLTVYETWGFAGRGRRGLGISALFAGASGTGKTLAAEVLSRELRLDLFRIDLSAVVSKYIGESEKNLRQVFDAAEEGGVLLLFDEADALFGKRAEVKDSHDRYANIEVSYLLQRMENFQGIAVLTTNLKSSLDKAFQRRLRFTVDFPFPGPQEREAIWRRVFPAAAPIRGLNFARLAQLNMTGGNIRNIALNAAFLAAETGSTIRMAHVLQATRQEAIKTERPLADNEIRGWE